MEGYKESLRLEEKSEATVEKYVRDAERFRRYVEENGGEISKETVLGYKERLKDEYKISSANSIIASVNSYLRYLGKGECCVKRYKQQREAYGIDRCDLHPNARANEQIARYLVDLPNLTNSQAAGFQTTAKDSRIFDECCALLEKAQGSYLEW